MSLRSASANGSRRASLRSAPGGGRPKPGGIENKSIVANSVTQLPSLGVTGSAFYNQQANRAQTSSKASRPPLPAAFNSRPRLGNPDAKEDKHTAVITTDDLQRLREQCGIGGARSEMETEKEWKAKERKEMMERSR